MFISESVIKLSSGALPLDICHEGLFGNLPTQIDECQYLIRLSDQMEHFRQSLIQIKNKYVNSIRLVVDENVCQEKCASFSDVFTSGVLIARIF